MAPIHFNVDKLLAKMAAVLDPQIAAVDDDSTDNHSANDQQPSCRRRMCSGDNLSHDRHQSNHGKFEIDHSFKSVFGQERIGQWIGFMKFWTVIQQDISHTHVQCVDQDKKTGFGLQRKLASPDTTAGLFAAFCILFL